MPRGYRCFLVALVGWLALTAANKPAQPQQKPVAAEKQQPPPSYAPHPNLSDDACYRAKDHEAADLCAQWRAAQANERAASATESANTLAALSVLLSAFALGALLWTLRQTEIALAEAKRGNEISEETAKRELRAYVILRNTRIEGLAPGQNPAINYEIVNVGQTPSYETRHWAKVFFAPSVATLADQKVRVGKLPYISRTTLGPGLPSKGGFHLLESGVLSDADHKQIMDGALVLGIAAAISYRDVFKRRRLTTVKLLLPVDRIDGEAGGFVACKKGNSAN